jgi:hypothetical protein
MRLEGISEAQARSLEEKVSRLEKGSDGKDVTGWGWDHQSWRSLESPRSADG